MNVITKAYLFNGTNDALVEDRFGRPSSSLFLNYGSMEGQNDVYIYGDFTLTAWVKMHTLEMLRRFIILNIQDTNPVYFSFTNNANAGPYYHFNGVNYDANSSLTIGNWQHLAFTIKESTLSIYIDAVLVYNGATTPISQQNQTFIIGYDQYRYPKVELDDIKIFNKSLTQTELIDCLSEKI
jgi:hypothetical protein